jgi:hypothetical protein
VRLAPCLCSSSALHATLMPELCPKAFSCWRPSPSPFWKRGCQDALRRDRPWCFTREQRDDTIVFVQTLTGIHEMHRDVLLRSEQADRLREIRLLTRGVAGRALANGPREQCAAVSATRSDCATIGLRSYSGRGRVVIAADDHALAAGMVRHHWASLKVGLTTVVAKPTSCMLAAWPAGRRLASGEATQVRYQHSRESMQSERTRPSARSGKILWLCEIFPMLPRASGQERPRAISRASAGMAIAVSE